MDRVSNRTQLHALLLRELKKPSLLYIPEQMPEVDATFDFPFTGELTEVSISLYINRISAVDENKEVN